jgi:hypothetical protein
MKTLQLVITIYVPDEVTPEMIEMSHYDEGYYICASNTGSDPIALMDENYILDSVNDIAHPETIHISWGIEDFEQRAGELELERAEDIDYLEGEEYEGEGGETPPQIYDRSKFSDALCQMKHHHDCCYGITWETIDYILDSYCLITDSKSI